MRTRALIVLSFALAALSGAPAAADNSQTVVVTLDSLNGSGENGTATLHAQGSKTVVVIKLANGSGVEQPAHFHVGTCDKYQPRPLYALEDVVDGKSTTTLNVPIDKLTGGELIVNVHKSYADIATQAACGVSKS